MKKIRFLNVQERMAFVLVVLFEASMMLAGYTAGYVTNPGPVSRALAEWLPLVGFLMMLCTLMGFAAIRVTTNDLMAEVRRRIGEDSRARAVPGMTHALPRILKFRELTKGMKAASVFALLSGIGFAVYGALDLFGLIPNNVPIPGPNGTLLYMAHWQSAVMAFFGSIMSFLFMQLIRLDITDPIDDETRRIFAQFSKDDWQNMPKH